MKQDSVVRVISQNIRYATTKPFKGEELWSVRRPRLMAQLRFLVRQSPESFICLQEVLHEQLVEILEDLNKDKSATNEACFIYIGVGRDDGKRGGEYSPIIYRADVWFLNKYETLWLSETPDTPSKGWDAASVRLLTIGVFEHINSYREIRIMNTHLDDQGETARRESSNLILKYLRSHPLGPDGGLPTVLAGDFNSEPNDEAYLTLNGSNSPLKDLREYVPLRERYGHDITYTGFGYEDEQPKRIDFLFIGPKTVVGEARDCGKELTVKGYSVMESRFDDGVYLSDHRAVVGDFLYNDRLPALRPEESESSDEDGVLVEREPE